MVAGLEWNFRIMKAFSQPRTLFRRRKQVEADIASALRALREGATIGLHLGAGTSRIEGMINCDLYNPNADRKVDATSLDGFENLSVDLIEHHHMIEHLSFDDFRRAVSEWHRVLKEGGHLVFTCPDIARICRRYLLLKVRGYLSDQSKETDYAIKMIVGSQEHEGMFHKNHFDPSRVRRIFPMHGFKVEYITAYPRRPTPSMLVIARKASGRN
ncbi:class I SAM-dependent methyltransferase [Ovoidimarina sediminis]|uniref:class I SAM-dependent methyltransferase n=1 Tax=Ovoidimarina sediminis TaxID=3079856 RepID=UPI00290D4E60|nr:methyltransferase domain-containing protein [Rhodophyticola sp. MJ-SS7]MDU8946153.1 methyltransferase domain-containing protein [Rhodophyticola sp. MJ-SS7]